MIFWFVLALVVSPALTQNYTASVSILGQFNALVLTITDQSQVRTIAVSPDGTRIVSGSSDNNNVKIWDMSSGTNTQVGSTRYAFLLTDLKWRLDLMTIRSFYGSFQPEIRY